MSDDHQDVEFLYVTDPMCSWCWGFAPVIESLRERFKDAVAMRYVMGGLAPDSDEPMAPETQAMVQGAWEAVAAHTGAQFNHEFWTECAPRRSTWPACRAVLAAERLRTGLAPAMFAGIQRAYYLEARNPSDAATLVQVAQALDLDGETFASLLGGPEVQADLERDFHLKESLRVGGFPSLALRSGKEVRVVSRGYAPLGEIEAALDSLGLLPDPERESR